MARFVKFKFISTLEVGLKISSYNSSWVLSSSKPEEETFEVVVVSLLESFSSLELLIPGVNEQLHTSNIDIAPKDISIFFHKFFLCFALVKIIKLMANSFYNLYPK